MKKLLLLLLAACATVPPPVFIDGEQGRLFVSDGGRGDALPVVFVHGNGGNLTQWNAQLAHVRKSRRAVAYDMRGMGRSDVPMNGDHSIAAMRDDLHRVVNTSNFDRVVLVAHSLGGAVALAYAAEHPERVAGVVLADAAGDVKVPREQANAWLDTLRMDKHEALRQAYEPILSTASADVRNAVLTSADRTSTETFVGAMAGMLDVDIAGFVQSIRAPMMAIAAVDDPNAFHVQFPQIPTRRMTGVGHWLMMEKPAEFNAILDEFLAKPL